jgi:hypothetical protein
LPVVPHTLEDFPMIRALVCSTALAVLSQILPGQCPPLVLSQGVQQAVSCSPTVFTVTPQAGRWNAVGVRSIADWNLTLLPAISSLPAGQQDFVVSNGYLGTPPFTNGSISIPILPLPGTLQHATLATIPPNTLIGDTLPPNDQLRLYEFLIATAGNYTVSVDSNFPLGWNLYNPGASAAWRPRVASVASGPTGPGGTTVALSPGWHCIAVSRDPTPAGTAQLTVSVTCGATLVAPAVNASVTISEPCQYLPLQPTQSTWNAVAITSPSDWDVTVAGATSGMPTTMFEAVVANGHLGWAQQAPATFHRVSGTAAATATHAIPVATLALGVASSATWDTSTVAQIYEFEVVQAGVYGVTIWGPPGIGGEIQLPGGSSAWRPRSLFHATSAVNGTTSHTLAPGWHAVLVSKQSASVQQSTVSVTVAALPNPTPTIGGCVPAQFVVGDAASTLSVYGSGFIPSSVVRWDGLPLATTFVDTMRLDAAVPAALLEQPAYLPLTVSSPAPGGGVSIPWQFTVAGPKILFLSPLSIPAPLGPNSASLAVTAVVLDAVNQAIPAALVAVYANGVQVPSSQYFGAIVFSLAPTTPGIQAEGAVAINVVAGNAMSNTVAIEIGPAANFGTVTLDPPQPTPGSAVRIEVEAGTPGAPMTLVVIFGAPDGTTLGTNPLPPGPTYSVPVPGMAWLGGLTMPSPALGVQVTLQGVYLDGGSALGFNLTWPRTIGI